jgi:hypothetical protein
VSACRASHLSPWQQPRLLQSGHAAGATINAAYASSAVATIEQRAGILSVPEPIPMTSFVTRVLSQLPEPTNTQAVNNYVLLQQFENVTDKFGGKVDVTLGPRATLFGRYGYRDVDAFRPALDTSPLGGRRQRADPGDEQAVGHQRHAHFWCDIAARSPIRRSSTQAGKNPTALLNRTNFRAPNGNRSAAAFGTITQTCDARQAQLGTKVLSWPS